MDIFGPFVDDGGLKAMVMATDPCLMKIKDSPLYRECLLRKGKDMRYR